MSRRCARWWLWGLSAVAIGSFGIAVTLILKGY